MPDSRFVYVECSGDPQAVVESIPASAGVGAVFLSRPLSVRRWDGVTLAALPFSLESIMPPGLKLLPEVITAEEETALADWLASTPRSSWHQLTSGRSVCHFGLDFQYGANRVDLTADPGEIPSILLAPLRRLLLPTDPSSPAPFPCLPDQCTINDYPPSTGISSHCDTHSVFSGPILSLSMLSPTTMTFSRPSGESIQVPLPRRSLLVMDGEARFAWLHGVREAKRDWIDQGLFLVRERRISVTFRKVNKQGECINCPFPPLCDQSK